MANNDSQLNALACERRTALPTCEAAAHLNRRPQTLRIWACRQNGPIRPLNINGRLAWPLFGQPGRHDVGR